MFIERARAVHGSKYDYSESIYRGTDEKLKIVCDEHGAFMQTPYKHTKRGQGCRKCGQKRLSQLKADTRDQFVKKAEQVHGHKYDYSGVVYINASTKVVIRCPRHGDFPQTPNAHLRPSGCPGCGRESLAEFRRSDTGTFVAKATKVHKNFYDYSLVDYFDNATNIEIICPIHGVFKQSPASHLIGRGCGECGKKRVSEARRSSTEAFIASARRIHGDTYDYSAVDYKKNVVPVEIHCKIHGKFLQEPQVHLQGSGCNDCGLKKQVAARTKSKEAFVKEALEVHDGLYEYDKVEYVSIHTKVLVRCTEHGLFSQQPASHLQGAGCPTCAGNEALTQEEFISRAKRAHGDLYDYSGAIYSNDHTKVDIRCSIHGTFAQSPNPHMRGAGCPRCFNKNEGKIAVILNERTIVHRQFRLKDRLFDFLLPDHNLIIERDGEQHYPKVYNRASSTIFNKRNSFAKQSEIDKLKTELAKQSGYKIARIPYWLDDKDLSTEIDNIVAGRPTYPDVPDPAQEEEKPKPKKRLK